MKIVPAIALGGLVLVAMPSASLTAAPVPQAVIYGPAVDPEALSLAREIVANGFPQEIRLQLMTGAMDAVIKQMIAAQGTGARDPGVQAIMDRHLAKMRDAMLKVVEKHIPALFDSYAYGYAREFSIEELRVIRDFSATPAGRRFISRSSAILSDPDVAAANQAYMKESLAVLPQLNEDLRDELTAYHEKHPDASID